MKRPSFQFYPADWRRDAALQSCSISARGFWVELMCVMHDCEPYGHLVIGGKPMTTAQIARVVGVSERECREFLAELEDAGVLSRDEAGVIFSRRMVRDERVRNARAEGGKAGAEHGSKGASYGAKGGRPKAVKGGFETPQETPLPRDEDPPNKPPPSSSSSSSSSKDHTSTRIDESLSRVRASVVGSDATPVAPPPRTRAGEICFALRQAGVQAVSPAHPMLLALIDAGAEVGEFIDAVPAAKEASNGFAYVLGTVRRRREEAAKAAQSLHRGPMPRTETPYERRARERAEAYAPGIAVRAPGADRNIVDLHEAPANVPLIQGH